MDSDQARQNTGLEQNARKIADFHCGRCLGDHGLQIYQQAKSYAIAGAG